VDRPADLVAAQRGNYALDLPPVAKANDIAQVAAALSTCGGLEAGGVAEALHQVGCVRKGKTAMDERRVHKLTLIH